MGEQNRRVDAFRWVKGRAGHRVADNWSRFPYWQLSRLAHSYLRWHGNASNDIARNGEQHVIERLALRPGATVLDVGANQGRWASRLLESNGEVTLHAFEPTPALSSALRTRFQGDSRVLIHDYALSDVTGTASLTLDRKDPAMNTLTTRRKGAQRAFEGIEVETRRGDDVVRDLGIERIDYLKIDVEGHDLRVLEGFAESLAAGTIDVLQFEYNGFAIHARSLLIDCYELLEPMGFVIGKIRPDGVRFLPYDAADENWMGPDCVAVLRSNSDLIARLACPNPRAGSSTG